MASADHNVVERVSVDTAANWTGSRVLATTTDGSRVFFATRVSTLPSCPAGGEVFYERSGGTTQPLTVGSDGHLDCADWFGGTSVDATHVFFQTVASLTPDDTDGGCEDIYERFAGTTRLVTTGPTDPQTPSPSCDYASAVLFSGDGTRVFFMTRAALVLQDTDTAADVYERSGGTTKLRSLKQDGTNSTVDETLQAISADGSKLFVSTLDQLVPQDSNAAVDLYERDEGTVKLLSNWGHGGGQTTPEFKAASDDGSRVIIRTGTPLDPNDTDGSIDIYELSNGQRTLLSTGTTGASEAAIPQFVSATPDATSVWFATTDPLTLDDADTTGDIYKRSGGTTILITTGPTAGSGLGASPLFITQVGNGASTYFATKEQLVPQDMDTDYDVYERSGGTTRLVAPGTTVLVSDDDSRVFFGTDQQLVPGDTDVYADIYEQHAGTTTLISSSPNPAASPTTGAVITHDGLSVYFGTYDNIGDDTNDAPDVYAARVAPAAPYPHPRGATPFLVHLVPFYVQCAGANPPNRTHGAPLAFQSCAPPKRLNTQVTIGTPDSNGQPAKSIGSLRVVTKAGRSSTPANEADVRLQVRESDIRKASDLSDYAGELEAALGVRQTDKDGPNAAGNGPASATSVDFPFHFAVACTPTPDATVGSACAIDTTANALTPGSVVESRRTIWQLQEVQVFDGGLDGLASTENDNLLFQVQGLFVP